MADDFTVRALTPETWDAFAALVEKHNGIFGGCWCIWFHPDGPERGQGYEGNRSLKRTYVEQGRAHAALVFDGDQAVAWCQYGTPEELPNMKHRKDYEAALRPVARLPADVHLHRPRLPQEGFDLDRPPRRPRPHRAGRRRGGRGLPQDLSDGRRVGNSFLYNSTRALYERAGFSYVRPKGKNHTVMRRTVDAG